MAASQSTCPMHPGVRQDVPGSGAEQTEPIAGLVATFGDDGAQADGEASASHGEDH
jgi:hypothetical protein